MDLPSKNMYDTFKDEIWKELGPLDPDWFETLTAQTLTDEGNVSDQDELCANQEGNFKAPFDKSPAESQLFSTPKVFRHSRVVSPETEDEHSFSAEHEKETLPWTATQSPCLFGMPKEGFQGAKHGSIQHQNEDSFDLLRSPQKSPVSHAKHISESLGAQIHPDMSWTSSLNTPPAIPSTLILTKPDESPCPLTVSADKNVVFVRKLFPSLSNASRNGAMSPRSSDMPTAHKGVVSPVAGQNPESLVSPQSSPNPSEGVWKPKLPDAIEDGEIRSTVASVLDGAEDVLSIFFTNSSSALRKVKTDRIKRKQIIPAKEHGCNSTDVSTTNNAASSEQKTSDEDSGRHLSPPPVKTGDVGNTQWSPLSLSDIPPCTADSSCHDNGQATHVENSISTEQLQRDFHSGQQSRPHMKITDSGFTKKKRKFVYTIKTSKLQFQGIEKQSQKMDSSPGIPNSGQNVNVKQLVRAPDEEECCNVSKNEMQRQGNLTEENLPPSVQAKIQDLDISQLSRDFAQDFSQMPELVTLTRVAEDTHRNGFSPSACLSAMKQANQKAGQANLAHDFNDVSNKRSVAKTYQNYSINEGTIGDSGFQSAVADTIHVTASSFAVPSSENNGHSQQCTGFKADIQRSTFTSTSKGSRKTQLDDDLHEAIIDAHMPSMIKGSKTLDPGRESELHVESTSNRPSSSARGTIDNTNCFPLNGQLHGGLPKETAVSLSSVHASGFKTASNKGIEISSANLERAKHLFEETEEERILSDQHIRCPHDAKHELGMSHGSVKETTFDSKQPPSSNEKSVDSSCQLTASQKADVTELCTFLEEAYSQFEFTQFKTGELKQDNVTSHHKVDNELDPDFLTGIDFDDSFNSDLEKHLRVHDKMSKVSEGETSTATSKSTGLSLSSEMKKENSSTEDASSSSKQISEGSKSVMSDENKNLYRAGHTETSKLEKNDPLMLGVGFKTAGGNVLRVSKKYLSKAKALFADLEENLMINEKSPDKQSSETDAKTQRIRDEDATECPNNSKVDTAKCQSGFQMASGKGISISAKAIQEADALFKDCDMMDTSADVSVKHKKSTEPLSGVGVSVSHKKNLQEFKNVQGMKANFSKEPINEVEDVNAGPTARHTDSEQHKVEIHNFSLKSTAALTGAASFHGNSSSTARGLSSLSYKTSKNIGSSVVNELSASVGFSTARGEKVLVSADALKKAECLLNDIDALQDTNAQRKQKDGALGTGHRVNQIQGSPPKNVGFQTANGKGFTISSAALKKAKMLLSECGEVDDKTGVKPSHSEMPVPSPAPRNRGFLAASGKPVAFSSEALQKAKALFGDITSSPETPADTRNGDKSQDKDKRMEKIYSGFSNAGGAKVHVSLDSTNAAALHGNPPLISTHPPLCQTSKNISCSANRELSNIGGFCTASGKKDSISGDAMTKAKSLFNENTTFEDANKLLKQKVDSLPQQNGGFQTASGKGVAISSAALKKAKTLLSVCEGVEDKIDVQPTCSKMTVPGPSGRSHGFVAASGKPVAFSSHLEKAKALFGDISSSAESPDVSNSRNSDKKQDKAENKEKIHCGFSTAGGAKVHVSPGNLLRAKNLLKEFDGSISATAMQEADAFFMDGDIMDSRDGITASGKNTSVSHEALTKAKSQFDENATFEKTNKWLTPKLETVPSQNGGFQTASGKGVAISTAALKKAKTLLSVCEGVEDKISVQPTCSKMTVPGPSGRSHGFVAASGKPVAFSSEALEKAKALFGDISSGAESPDVSNSRNSDKKQDKAENKEKIHCGFSTAGGAKVHVSPGNLLSAKNLLKEFDGSISATAMQEADAFFMDGDIMDSRDGITASGKNASLSHDALTNAKSQFDENATFEKTNKWLTPKLETVPSQIGGFQTASGKGVAISSAALKKAKTLFSECEGVQDKISVQPTCSKMPVTGPPPRNHGFLAASGKPVAISSEAYEKAKALFGDISPSSEIPTVSCTRNIEQEDALNDKEKTHCGFSTAGGAKVYVSQNNLLKAKNLLKDLANGECHDLSPHDSHKSVVNNVTRTVNFPTASDKDIPTKDSALEEVKCVSSLQQFDPEIETFQKSNALVNILIKAKAPTDASKVKEGKMTNFHDSPQEEMACVLDPEINQTSSSEGKQTEESSVLYCHSLNLTGCTETQRRFLAQEALDCTKALLEDENLSEQKLSMTSVNVPLQDNPKSFDGSVEEQKPKGKRLVEDPDMTGQPPLKRRLLEEFDRTVDGPRGSALEPQKSSPNGATKDRRVFKYSASLHPNITRPHRNGTNYVETRLQKTTPTQHSTPGDSISAHSKMSMFVPPFLKNVKTESLNHAVLKDNVRTPSAFVPPFKKQRTIVQESSSKPPEEDKQHHLFVMPLKSNTYVPPTKNTQLSVTDNKSKEDVQMVTLADTTKDNLINKQSLPVGCEPEESSTEASLLEDKLPQSQDMFQNLHNVELARDMQDMRLRKKKRQTIRPLPGSLFLTKTSGVPRIPLMAAVNGKPPARYTQKQLYSRGLHQHVCEITNDTAECFRFSLKQFVKQEAFIDGGGVQLADGGWLIPSNDGTAGKEEFYRALCDTPGVDPKLISEEWVYNHYRWIVWKQASMERSFPETMGSLCLTPEQVLLQLKYRYDVEVDHSRRPALRKIMEQDDTAAKTLVLCVCGVVSGGHSTKRQSVVKTPSSDAKVENQSGVVWLTDGWYGIKTQLDEPLTAMLQKGRLAVGGKLIISGAQLVGSQAACSPLEAPDSLMLKICANSSRPARWDAKLGFHRDPRPLLLPVSSLYSNGGPVGCVDIVILRSYPIQWMERKPDGGVVFRSVRAEEKEVRRYNSHKQKAMESLFAKVQDEFEKEERGNKKPQRRRRTMSRQDIAGLQDGEELYEAVGNDPAYLEAHLSEQQLQTLHSYRRSLMEKKQAELQDRYRRALESAEDREGSCPKRDVTPVWRLCIADSTDQHGGVYQLNLWRPPSDLQSLLKEGCRYKVYHLTASEGKKPVGSTCVQLTGTKKTQFQDLQASQEWLSAHFQPRFSTHFVDLLNPEFQPLCGEVDLTGYVISIIDGQGFSPAFYLADGNLNFIKVRCFSSLAQSGLEDVVKPRVLLALSNLQLRGQSTSPTPVVFAGDLTVFSTNPKEVHLQESLSQLRNLLQGQANFSQTAEEKLSHLIKCDGLSSISSPALQTRTPASAPTTDRRQDTKTSVTSQQPVRSSGSFTPLSRNPPAQNCSTEKEPSILKRRRALDYLSRIPSPPPLSNLGSVASPCVNRTFVPPRRSVTPSTLKTVQTPARKAVSSPVEEEWVNDEELAMIDTQALLDGDLM